MLTRLQTSGAKKYNLFVYASIDHTNQIIQYIPFGVTDSSGGITFHLCVEEILDLVT